MDHALTKLTHRHVRAKHVRELSKYERSYYPCFFFCGKQMMRMKKPAGISQ